MDFLDNISLCTYTNKKYSDVLKVYLPQIKKHFPIKNNYVFTDDNVTDDEHVKYLQYQNSDDYYVQYTNCLKQINTEYIIYAQEDFILYDDVDLDKLSYYQNFLNEHDNMSFVRLIRTHSNITKEKLNHLKDDLYHVEKNENLFLMQATLWKKKDLLNVYYESKSKKWYEGDIWINACKILDINGVFCYNNEQLRGKAHCDSIIYPYMCTAVNKGKWNMNEYGDKLQKMFTEYKVDYKKRGTRINYGVYT